MTLSTHVLDVETGLPVAGLRVHAERLDDVWTTVGSATTDHDGRVRELVGAPAWRPGRWRVVFDTAARSTFYPRVSIEVAVEDDGPCHVPLLLAGHAYTTYRGS